MKTLKEKLIRLAYQKTELRPHLLPLLTREAGNKATTPEGAKKLFDAYKEKHPKTEKGPKDFYEAPQKKDPGKDDKKPGKKTSLKDMNKELSKEKAQAQEKAKDIKIPEKAQQAFSDMSSGKKVGVVASTVAGGLTGYVLGGTMTSAAVGVAMAGLGITAVVGLPALGIGLGILAGALVCGYLGSKGAYGWSSKLGAEGLTEDQIKALIVDKMHDLNEEDAKILQESFKGGKLDKAKLLSLTQARVKKMTATSL